MDSLHKENSDMCMGISEYGADTNVQYHSDAPKRQDYTEEYQSYYHEKASGNTGTTVSLVQLCVEYVRFCGR